MVGCYQVCATHARLLTMRMVTDRIIFRKNPKVNRFTSSDEILEQRSLLEARFRKLTWQEAMSIYHSQRGLKQEKRGGVVAEDLN